MLYPIELRGRMAMRRGFGRDPTPDVMASRFAALERTGRRLIQDYLTQHVSRKKHRSETDRDGLLVSFPLLGIGLQNALHDADADQRTIAR